MIYLDHASTTPVDPKVVKKMTPYFTDIFGNPSGMYKVSREAQKVLELSRKSVADFLGAKPNEITFTSGGTESDNMAILGVARACRGKGEASAKSPVVMAKGGHIITSKIEHSAVLNSCRQLEREGFRVSYLDVDSDGIVRLDQLKKELSRDTVLVSIMYANNEIGTIQPIAKIAKIISDFKKTANRELPTANQKTAKPFFHTDACQGTLYLKMDVEKLGVDLLTFNGSKIYAPKGVGVLYVKEGTKIAPVIFGGHQENGLRPGTQNLPYIVAIAEAVKIIKKHDFKNETKLRDYLTYELLKIENSHLNGSRMTRLPNNVNITFDGVEGEALVLYLDKAGLATSTGSACMSASLQPSHVIMALGKSEQSAHSSLRITLGRENTIAQAERVVSVINETVKELRQMSAIYESKI